MTVLIDAPERAPAETDKGDGLTHVVCDCQMVQAIVGGTPVALCGRVVDDKVSPKDHQLDEGEPLCLVCADLNEQPCPKCGATS